MASNYRSAPGISGTQMARLYLNPELYHFEQDPANSQFIKRESTPAMQFGTAVHLAILEPDQFQKRHFVLREVESYATKDGIAAKKEAVNWASENEVTEPLILKSIELASIRLMAASFSRAWDNYNTDNFDALGDWSNAQKEHVVFGEHEGVKLKGQIDILTCGYDVVCDIKTTSAFEWFEKDIERNGYDVQLTHYAKLGDAAEQIIFFALESVPPFRCSVHKKIIVAEKWQAAFDNFKKPHGPWIKA